MSAIPKPEPRGQKPRRRIASKSKRAPVRAGRPRAKRTAKRKASRMQLRKLCDEIFSVTIRLLGRGRCRLCGAAVGQAVQCAHLISRRYLALRWEESNAWALCAADHVRYTHDPVGWHFRIIAEFGAEADPSGEITPEQATQAGRERLDDMMATALRGLDAPPLYAEIAPHLVEGLENAHRAVPYDALTEALHERARELLAKAERMIG